MPPVRHSRESGNPGGVGPGEQRLGTPPPPLDSRFPGRVKTLTSGHERPIRHSRESGNPGVLEGSPRGVSPLHPAWIPAFAGMTISGAVAPLGWGFDTACFAGMTVWGALPLSDSGGSLPLSDGVLHSLFRGNDGFGLTTNFVPMTDSGCGAISCRQRRRLLRLPACHCGRAPHAEGRSSSWASRFLSSRVSIRMEVARTSMSSFSMAGRRFRSSVSTTSKSTKSW